MYFHIDAFYISHFQVFCTLWKMWHFVKSVIAAKTFIPTYFIDGSFPSKYEYYNYFLHLQADIYLNSKPIQKCEYNFLPNKLTKLKKEKNLSPKFHHRVPKSVLLSCLTATSLLTSSVREWVKTGKSAKK